MQSWNQHIDISKIEIEGVAKNLNIQVHCRHPYQHHIMNIKWTEASHFITIWNSWGQHHGAYGIHRHLDHAHNLLAHENSKNQETARVWVPQGHALFQLDMGSLCGLPRTCHECILGHGRSGVDLLFELHRGCVLGHVFDYLIEEPTFRRLGSGTYLVFKNPNGFELQRTGYVVVMLPWIAKYQWHAFSVFPHATEPNTSCVCIGKLGDWSKKLHDEIKRPTSRPVWVSGPFISPFASGKFEIEILKKIMCINFCVYNFNSNMNLLELFF